MGARDQSTRKSQRKVRRSIEVTSPPKRKNDIRIASNRKKQEQSDQVKASKKDNEEDKRKNGNIKLQKFPVRSRRRKADAGAEEQSPPSEGCRSAFAKRARLSVSVEGKVKDSKPNKLNRTAKGCAKESPACKNKQNSKVGKDVKESKIVLCNNLSVSLEQSVFKESESKKSTRHLRGVKQSRATKVVRTLPVTRRSSAEAKASKVIKKPKKNATKVKKDLKESKNSKENKEPNLSQETSSAVNHNEVMTQLLSTSLTSSTDVKSPQKTKTVSIRKTKLQRDSAKKQSKDIFKKSKDVDGSFKPVLESKIANANKEILNNGKDDESSSNKDLDEVIHIPVKPVLINNNSDSSEKVPKTVLCKLPIKKEDISTNSKMKSPTQNLSNKSTFQNTKADLAKNISTMPKPKGKRTSKTLKSEKPCKMVKKTDDNKISDGASEMMKVIEIIKAEVMESIVNDKKLEKSRKDDLVGKASSQCSNCKRDFCNKSSLTRHMKKCMIVAQDPLINNVGNKVENGSTKELSSKTISEESANVTKSQNNSTNISNLPLSGSLGQVLEIVPAAETKNVKTAKQPLEASTEILKVPLHATNSINNDSVITKAFNASVSLGSMTEMSDVYKETTVQTAAVTVANSIEPLSSPDTQLNANVNENHAAVEEVDFTSKICDEPEKKCAKEQVGQDSDLYKAANIDAAAAAVVAAVVAKIGMENGTAVSVVKPKPHFCEHCDFKTGKHSLLARHVETHGIFMCLKCRFVGENKENCDAHMRESHKKKRSAKLCRQCRKYIDTDVVSMEKHKEECSVRILNCKECNKVFRYESSLKVHMATHYPELPKRFHCMECSYQSNYKANLQKHMKSIHEFREKNVKCCICEKMFFSEDSMKRHLKVHSDDRPHKCDLCGKAFKTLPALKTHRDVHEPSRPFLCEVQGCTKDFRTARLLKNHREEYHQLSPKKYHCSKEGCRFSFFKRSHLRRHEITHTDERNFKCAWPDCGKAFRHSDNLKVHYLQHTNEKPVKCNLCDFTCRQKSSLHWHKRKRHANEIAPALKVEPKKEIVSTSSAASAVVAQVTTTTATTTSSNCSSTTTATTITTTAATSNNVPVKSTTKILNDLQTKIQASFDLYEFQSDDDSTTDVMDMFCKRTDRGSTNGKVADTSSSFKAGPETALIEASTTLSEPATTKMITQEKSSNVELESKKQTDIKNTAVLSGISSVLSTVSTSSPQRVVKKRQSKKAKPADLATVSTIGKQEKRLPEMSELSPSVMSVIQVPVIKTEPAITEGKSDKEEEKGEEEKEEGKEEEEEEEDVMAQVSYESTIESKTGAVESEEHCLVSCQEKDIQECVSEQAQANDSQTVVSVEHHSTAPVMLPPLISLPPITSLDVSLSTSTPITSTPSYHHSSVTTPSSSPSPLPPPPSSQLQPEPSLPEQDAQLSESFADNETASVKDTIESINDTAVTNDCSAIDSMLRPSPFTSTSTPLSVSVHDMDNLENGNPDYSSSPSPSSSASSSSSSSSVMSSSASSFSDSEPEDNEEMKETEGESKLIEQHYHLSPAQQPLLETLSSSSSSTSPSEQQASSHPNEPLYMQPEQNNCRSNEPGQLEMDLTTTLPQESDSESEHSSSDGKDDEEEDEEEDEDVDDDDDEERINGNNCKDDIKQKEMLDIRECSILHSLQPCSVSLDNLMMDPKVQAITLTKDNLLRPVPERKNGIVQSYHVHNFSSQSGSNEVTMDYRNSPKQDMRNVLDSDNSVLDNNCNTPTELDDHLNNNQNLTQTSDHLAVPSCSEPNQMLPEPQEHQYLQERKVYDSYQFQPPEIIMPHTPSAPIGLMHNFKPQERMKQLQEDYLKRNQRRYEMMQEQHQMNFVHDPQQNYRENNNLPYNHHQSDHMFGESKLICQNQSNEHKMVNEQELLQQQQQQQQQDTKLTHDLRINEECSEEEQMEDNMVHEHQRRGEMVCDQKLSFDNQRTEEVNNCQRQDNIAHEQDLAYEQQRDDVICEQQQQQQQHQQQQKEQQQHQQFAAPNVQALSHQLKALNISPNNIQLSPCMNESRFSKLTIQIPQGMTKPMHTLYFQHNNQGNERSHLIAAQVQRAPVCETQISLSSCNNITASGHTGIGISSGGAVAAGGSGESIHINLPRKKAPSPPGPVQAWGAKQPAIIMNSVKSREVQKPKLQTATAPLTAPVSSSPSSSTTTAVTTLSSSSSSSSTASTTTTATSGSSQSYISSVQTTILPPNQAQGRQQTASPTKRDVRIKILVPNSLQIDIKNQGANPLYSQNPTAPSFHLDFYQRPPSDTTSSTPRSDSPVSRATNQSPMSIQSTTSVQSTTSTPSSGSDIPSKPPPPYPGRILNITQSSSPPIPTQTSSKLLAPCPVKPIPIQQAPPNVVPSDNFGSSVNTQVTQTSMYERPSLSNRRSSMENNQKEEWCAVERTHTESAEEREEKHRCTSPIPEWKSEYRSPDQERVRNYSPQAYKFFMEQHVENVMKSTTQRMWRRMQLENEMSKVGLSSNAQQQMRKILHQKESNYIRLKRAKLEKHMFEKLTTLGIGAFGEVALVRKKDMGQLYAMKTLRKSDVLQRNQVAHVKAERDILAEADNEWVVKLYYSFQDKDFLYFVMDYVPGGDLMGLLIKYEIFEEHLAQFYIAELVLAIESVHKMGFIHRDIKPDNILIDREGHIKLTDFGLSTGFRWTHNSKYYQKDGCHPRQGSMDVVLKEESCCCDQLKPLEVKYQEQRQRCLAHSLVGTPNYIAPEVLIRSGYTMCCDWWSVGVILYEMLVGQPPFYAANPAETQYKVINWQEHLHVPFKKLSSASTDLMLSLLSDPSQRLGRNGADEIKHHAFFDGLSFNGLRQQPAPYAPTILYPTDTSNFDPVDLDKLQKDNNDGHHSQLPPEHGFFEFTFRRFFDDGGHPYPDRSTVFV